MKFINKSNNTIFLSELDRNIFYDGYSVEYISPGDILKSPAFQQMIKDGIIEIVEIENHRIERNLKRYSAMTTFKHQNKSSSKSETNVNSSYVNNSDQETDSPEVVLKGHFLEGGGYAKVNRNLALGLKSLGLDVKIDVSKKTRPELTEPEMSSLYPLRKKSSRNAIHIDSIIPSFSDMSFGGKYSILYTTIEAQTIPQQFIDVAHSYHEVWTTSDFCAKVLKNSGVKTPVYVLPDSVNINKYTPEGDKFDFKPDAKNFVFLSVFNWSYRKGYDVLLKSYLQEFSGDDDVSLLLACKSDSDPKKSDVIKKDVDRFIKECGGDNPPHVIRCSKFIPESNMPSLYRACDAYVSYTRGEGYCLPYVESALCGLPVIATNVSGQTMYLNKDNSYLLDVDYFQTIQRGQMNVHFWDGQEFPALNTDNTIDKAGKLMREVYENYNEAKQKNEKLQNTIRKNFSIDAVSKAASDRLIEIDRSTKK